jgi:hypothetical protein
VSDLSILFQKTSQKCSKIQFGRDDLLVTVLDPSENRIYGHWMAVALLFSFEIKIFFKLHFCSRAVAGMIRNVDPNFEGGSRCIEFMKLLAVVNSNEIRSSFEKSGTDLGVSPPIVVRGFDQIFFDNSDDENCIVSSWKIGEGSHSITCSLFAKIFDYSILSRIK